MHVNEGVEAIISSAHLAGFSGGSRQELFNLGMLVESDPLVVAQFHKNLAVELRAPNCDVDIFSIMHATLATLSWSEKMLLRRRVSKARSKEKGEAYDVSTLGLRHG